MDRERLLEVNTGEGAPNPASGSVTLPEAPETGRMSGGGFRRPAGVPFGDPHVAQYTDELRQRVQSAVAFHVGGKLPGIEFTKAVNPIADRFLELAAGDPQMVSALEADVNAMFALTDDDLAGKVARGEPLSQFGDVWDAIAEVSWEVGATDLAARLEAERADAIKGTFDALTHTEALTLGVDGSAIGQGSRFTRQTPDTTKAQAFESLFDVAGAWSYSPTSRVLAVTVGEQTIGVRARPGFDPENHLDVMAEVVSAQADGRIAGGSLTGDQRGNVQVMIDKAHQVGAWIDQHPFAQSAVDAIWNGLTLNPTGSGLEMEREQLEEQKATIDETSLRVASVIPFPEDATIAALARKLMGDREGLGSADALAAAASMVDENRDQLTAEFESLTQEELIGQIEADLEGQSALGAAVEGTMQNALEKLEWWDSFSQTIGVNFIDAVGDLLGAGEALMAGPDGGSDIEEGWRRLQAVFEPVEGDPDQEFLGLGAVTAAEYFDLEGGAADLANLVVGGVFDPTNLLIPGAKGLRAMAKRALVDPKYAGIYLRMGQIPHVVNQIAGTTRASRWKSRLGAVADDVLKPGDTVAVEGLIGPGLPVPGMGEVADDAAREAAEQAARETSAKAVRNVAALSGLGDEEYMDLFRLALDPESTPAQVNEVLTRGLHKDWLGEGPQRAIRHSTVEGIGRALESLGAGKLSDEAADTVMKMVAKLSVGRSFRVGESQSLDNFFDLLTQFFPADKDKFAEWAMRAVERRMAGGDNLALKGAAQLQKEQARRVASNTGGAIRSINIGVGGDLRTVQANIHQIEDTLAHLHAEPFDDATKTALREQLERTHAIMSRRVAEASPRVAEMQARRQAAQKQIKQATYLEADVANAARNQMGALPFELYEDIAQQINADFGREVIPKTGKTNPLAPHIPERDWSELRGLTRGVAGNDKDLSLMMGLAVDDIDSARALDAVGMFNRSQHVVLPASPYEVILFQKLARNETAFAAYQKYMRNEFMKKMTRGVRLAFAFNLLINPLTAGKVTLDETMRFLADTGDVSAFLRATLAGMPGVGRTSESVIQKVRSTFGDAVVNPYGLAYKRNVGGMSPDDFAQYEWVQRPPRRVTDPARLNLRQYRETAERWVNGTLLRDRRFREYARWLDQATVLENGTKVPPPGFVEWWENGDGMVRPGRADVRETMVDIAGDRRLGNELTASDAFNILDQTFSHWLDAVVDEGARDTVRKALLGVAREDRGALDVVKDARVFNAIQRVPGLSPNTDFGSGIFNLFFGAPSGRRAGVFYEHYYDEAMAILTERHKGRILTVDDVVEAGAPDVETARFWLKQGADNRVVSQLIADTGMRTEAQLASRASQYAERRADDLMYRFTSASLVGRGVDSPLVFPFARAQVDFLSWWVDHMTKPLNLFGRVGPEVRAKLPGFVQETMATVDRMPINLRAWGKYAHLAATVNNDHESVIDQAVTNLTFFPLRFDNEFLLSVTPQLGPVPSWLFDIMVDKGMISEEVEANFEALFPALAFTEFEGDYAGDAFNRILPTSRRSVRDGVVGMMRGAYAMFGNDIHTSDDWLGQVANLIGDNKVPVATGDFQAALAADYFAGDFWDIVPGSDEWETKIREIAVKGAVEANRQEWSADWTDRVYPLAQADKEYRAIRAYEGMFEDATFQRLTALNVFAENDLVEVDGKARIVEVWDRYLEGRATGEELAWLDDRLTTAYFETGRHDIVDGFSVMDYLNLSNPELSVNLINKSEDSGVPVRSEEHADFKRRHVNPLTGRLQNIPPGETGREIYSEARRRGWVTSRPVEEWATDAAFAVYSSGRRAVRAAWQRVSHRTWQEGLKKSIEDKKFSLDGFSAEVLGLAGLDVDAGTEFTYGEFYELLDAFDERFDVSQPMLIDTLARGAVHGQLARHNDAFGIGLLDNIENADREFSKLGIDSVEDWPVEAKAEARRLFSEAITLGYTTEADYSREIEPIFGPINYEPPTPPAVDELEAGISLTGDELRDMEVIDGDTVSVLLEDGPMRVRLIGINAPEVTQDGYGQARDNLAEVVAGAGDVVLGFYQPETFGLTQLSAPGERRLLAWLYVDGVPIYDPSVFGADNPRGAGVGGRVVDLAAILEAGR